MKTSLFSLAAFALVAAGCASLCLEPGKPNATVGDLLPGEYRLLLTATEGSRGGRQVRGRLWLVRDEHHWSETKLYGHVQLDFAAVAAPMDFGEGPDPKSEDPRNPGVLVLVDSSEKIPVLAVGTVSNKNPVIGRTPDGSEEIIEGSADGAGIGLWVHRISNRGFVGRWAEWGIVVDGRGTFCATRVSDHGL